MPGVFLAVEYESDTCLSVSGLVLKVESKKYIANIGGLKDVRPKTIQYGIVKRNQTGEVANWGGGPK